MHSERASGHAAMLSRADKFLAEHGGSGFEIVQVHELEVVILGREQTAILARNRDCQPNGHLVGPVVEGRFGVAEIGPVAASLGNAEPYGKLEGLR
jgi:hypothetical protein